MNDSRQTGNGQRLLVFDHDVGYVKSARELARPPHHPPLVFPPG